MTIKIDADTSSGLQLESDTSGIIDIQSAGVTKMTVGTTIDVQGNELVLDADGDTSIHADTDDQIDFKTGGTDRMVIDSSGNVLMGKTTADDGATAGFEFDTNDKIFITDDASSSLVVNRLSSDGNMQLFKQDGTTEGTISVSGTTVSYNGGHLSRWGRLSDNSQPTILKGTVMSNLDEMVVWEVDGVAVENEQRNQLKVSDVEGDINVAGLFVKWDKEEDGYNDIDLAMTGDMIIRIAQGTTVQRGDLLMSAGDGTAKPQGDDIVRSKTIAKVTSTTVINTYDDNSYVVPCVVMAC